MGDNRISMEVTTRIYHRGVLRVAGVVHVGTPAAQVAGYLRDAQGYADGGLRAREHALRMLREDAEQRDECARRSLISAAVAMLAWGLS